MDINIKDDKLQNHLDIIYKRHICKVSKSNHFLLHLNQAVIPGCEADERTHGTEEGVEQDAQGT